MSQNFDIEKIRSDFPCLNQMVYGKTLVYLDSAATAQKPKCVIEALKNYYEKYCANVNRGAYFLGEKSTKLYDQARKDVANFVGAKNAQQIIFTRSTTEGTNLVASGLSENYFEPGDEIIVTEMDHHSNIVPWFRLAQKLDLKLKVVKVADDGTLDLEHYKNLFSAKTKLAAFVHVSNALGTINPVKEMCTIAREKNVLTFVDGAQAIHHVPVNLFDMRPTFYAFSGHKAYGPTGIGALFIDEEWLERLPPYQSGGDMIASVSFEKISYAKAPQKFEAGTPNIAGAIGFAAALNYLREIGFVAIHEHEQALLKYALAELRKIPQVIIFSEAKESVSLISFALKGVHPHDVISIFDREGVAIRGGHLCCEPLVRRFKQSAFCRASFALYNTRDDVDRLVAAIKKVIEVFKI